MRPLAVATALALLLSGVAVAPSSSAAEACPSGHVALTFDDGGSSFRAQVLRVLREERVPATFFEFGMRVVANPQLTRAAVADGHVVLNHTYGHPDLGEVSPEDVRYEVLAAEQVYREAGVAMPFKGLREPYGGGDDASREVIDRLGYVRIGASVGGADFVPGTPAVVIRESILNGLGPGGIILMHDGPADTAAGAAVVEALPGVIDGARDRGYCFGALDARGQVVPARLTPARASVPGVVHPVPYLPNLLPPVAPPAPHAFVTGLPARYLLVELADLRAAVAPALLSDLRTRTRTAEAAQLRGDVAGQRAGLQAVLAAVRAAPSRQISPTARQRLTALAGRLLSSLDES